MSLDVDPYGASGIVTKLCPFCKTEVVMGYTRGCEDCCRLFGIERYPAPLVTKAKKEKRAVVVRMNRVRVERGEKPQKLRPYLHKVRDHWRFVVGAGQEIRDDS